MAKKIELKTEKLGEQEFSYVDQLVSIISMGVGGEAMSAKEMFEAQPIVEKLKDHEGADAIGPIGQDIGPDPLRLIVSVQVIHPEAEQLDSLRADLGFSRGNSACHSHGVHRRDHRQSRSRRRSPGSSRVRNLRRFSSRRSSPG